MEWYLASVPVLQTSACGILRHQCGTDDRENLGNDADDGADGGLLGLGRLLGYSAKMLHFIAPYVASS